MVAAGAALLLAGLGAGSVLVGIALVVIGVALGLPAFRRLVPAGTLVARRGLPATVLVRGVLTFAFFAGDAYVSYALITVRGLTAAVAGIALTAATLTWTAASWLQARWLDRFGASRFVAAGFAGVALGSLAMLLVLVPAVPAAVGISCWSIAGFGIGLAYAPLSVVTLHEAPEGQEGRATSSLQLSDMLGTALGLGGGRGAGRPRRGGDRLRHAGPGRRLPARRLGRRGRHGAGPPGAGASGTTLRSVDDLGERSVADTNHGAEPARCTGSG